MVQGPNALTVLDPCLVLSEPFIRVWRALEQVESLLQFCYPFDHSRGNLLDYWISDPALPFHRQVWIIPYLPAIHYHCLPGSGADNRYVIFHLWKISGINIQYP